MRRLLLTIAIVTFSLTSWAKSPIAKVEQGELKGTIEDGLTVYRGVPFAAPPACAAACRQVAGHSAGG
jgi:para-nitrobenzyl esterase